MPTPYLYLYLYLYLHLLNSVLHYLYLHRMCNFKVKQIKSPIFVSGKFLLQWPPLSTGFGLRAQLRQLEVQTLLNVHVEPEVPELSRLTYLLHSHINNICTKYYSNVLTEKPINDGSMLSHLAKYCHETSSGEYVQGN